MKMSQWLREYQLTGELLEGEKLEFAFWAGWLIGHLSGTAATLDEKREMAIRAAEFIEEQR